MTNNNNRIVLGSGELYITEYTSTLPSVDEICVEENRLGYVSGGASIEYKPSYYTAKDDLGYVSKQIITDETATLKSGVLTFDGDTLAKLCETGRVSEENGMRVVKIGGIKNSNRKRYCICFHVHDEIDGDVWVLIVGRNEAGFSLSFAKDKETVIDAEFVCTPMDEEGTLIQYVEEFASGAQG